ncbi:hypothetical protein [Rheinheimera sp. UJ63]|uniref:hypothetical protein n=1 Tax=Rheinheimera sp. UJ63 TaxID=2910157 RepID=UPI001F2E7053|nr:hypothetical protein [Rheinheimera sp. UJ63]MCF4010092.1 hypothetical protein [Rheinheimera sp. UJ63]
MVVVPVVWLMVVIGVYIAALRSGMRALQWAIAAIFTGPLLLPLFNSYKRLAIHRARTKNARIFRP